MDCVVKWSKEYGQQSEITATQLKSQPNRTFLKNIYMYILLKPLLKIHVHPLHLLNLLMQPITQHDTIILYSNRLKII